MWSQHDNTQNNQVQLPSHYSTSGSATKYHVGTQDPPKPTFPASLSRNNMALCDLKRQEWGRAVDTTTEILQRNAKNTKVLWKNWERAVLHLDTIMLLQ